MDAHLVYRPAVFRITFFLCLLQVVLHGPMYLRRSGIGYDKLCAYFAASGVFPNSCEPLLLG